MKSSITEVCSDGSIEMNADNGTQLNIQETTPVIKRFLSTW